MRLTSYLLHCDSDRSVTFRTDLTFFKDRFLCKPMKGSWRTPELLVFGKSKPARDFVGFSLTAPVISERAVEWLSPLISEHCETLPFTDFKGKHAYFALNVLGIYDCLDFKKSACHEPSGDPHEEFGVFHRLYLDQEKLPDVPIFKVYGSRMVFVDNRFVDRVIEGKLTNAKFGDPTELLLPMIVHGKDTNAVPEAFF